MRDPPLLGLDEQDHMTPLECFIQGRVGKSLPCGLQKSSFTLGIDWGNPSFVVVAPLECFIQDGVGKSLPGGSQRTIYSQEDDFDSSLPTSAVARQ